MWIVKLALRRPYTFVVVSILVLIFGIGFILKMPKDIFPNINIPVVSLIWTYNGLPAEDFEQRITTYSEFSLSNYVNDIDRIESQTTDGLALIRVYFHPEAEIEAAVAQATATSQAVLRRMPNGVLPPVILRYSASSVPIIQMSLSSETMNEAELYDYAVFRIRQAIATIRGTTIPTPRGGKVRQVMIDIDPKSLQSKGLSARDVNEAVNNFNLTLPTGNVKIGATDHRVNINMTPEHIKSMNDFPIKVIDDVVVYLRDVAFAHDGFLDQTNIVRNQGERSVLLTILKNGAISTLNIINDLKKMLPNLQAAAPEGMKINLLFDQSVFVRAAIQGVVLEGALAALLTGLMILLFLGSWRSTFIVIVSIPLSILTSIICLGLMGETLNIMTLGGLALSIGILVDNATVTIENIHRQLESGKSLHNAILDGSYQVAVPAFVSTLAICIVFLPVALLVGPSKFLFTPFAYAVVFAITASYFFSRTLVPVLIKYMLAGEVHLHVNTYNGNGEIVRKRPKGNFQRFTFYFNSLFHRVRSRYERILDWCLHFKLPIYLMFAILFASSLVVFPYIGRNFFPDVDADLIRLHVKAPTGTRLEVTEEIFASVEKEIKKVIPKEEIALLIDNIGLPSEPSSLAFGDNATVGPSDGEILISLHPQHSFSTQEYMKKLRVHLKERFPDLLFYFQPADMINQILNFGLPSPIDVKVTGHDKAGNIAIAKELVERIARVPGAVDVHMHQVLDEPELYLDVDRTLLFEKGVNQHDLVNDLLSTYSTSSQVNPNFWLDRQSGIPYPVAVQFPKYRVHSSEQFMRMPVGSPLTKEAPLLDNLAQMERRVGVGVASHLNIEPVFDIYANIQDRDLGGVSSDISDIIDEFQGKMKPGNRILLKGSVENMDIAFNYLGGGFLLALILIYFILVINFQSWLDPFIIIMAIPGAITGICWMLFLTHTTFSVPALMGTIMCVGVATANSILIVTFANYQLKMGKPSFEAILIACETRLRPVLMTALAMIVGMIPMALGLGEGGEQNAPLGRSVIGGLFIATFTTLFFVPVMFAALRKKSNPYIEHEELSEELSKS
jgi:multidrug efflux pump subunit AcrB